MRLQNLEQPVSVAKVEVGARHAAGRSGGSGALGYSPEAACGHPGDGACALKAVWITRTQPGAEETAARVRALGFEAVVEPLLVAEPVGEGPLDLADVGALAFTSAAAIRAFAARSSERGLPVFAVGGATAAAARTAGFAEVVSAEGDVEALAGCILARPPATGWVLHPAPGEPAGDLVGALAAGGVDARRLTLYQTVPRAPPPALLARLPRLDAVLVHSPRAAGLLADILRAHAGAEALRAVCLSTAGAAPLAGALDRPPAVAAAPTETALLEALTHAVA